MKKLFIFFILVFLRIPMQAQESKTAYNFLRLPVSAHAAAMGGVNISLIEDDASLVFHNPALLSSVSDKTLNLNYSNYIKGVNALSAVFNKTIKEKTSVAVSAQYMNYGTLSERTADNTEIGTFAPKDIAVGGYLSYILAQNIAGAIGIKMISSNIGAYSSFAMGVDLGLNYYHPETEWSVSMVIKNLGGQLKAYDNEYEKLPAEVQIGVSKRLEHMPLRFSATLIDLNHGGYPLLQHLALGMDALLSQNIWAGIGYNPRLSNEMKITSAETTAAHGAGLTLGAGINLERFKLNLAYGKYHVSGASLVVNVGYSL